MRKNRGKMRKKGENHSDPIYTNPIKNLPKYRPFPHKLISEDFILANFAWVPHAEPIPKILTN